MLFNIVQNNPPEFSRQFFINTSIHNMGIRVAKSRMDVGLELITEAMMRLFGVFIILVVIIIKIG
jgi:hypothetical protein